MFGRDKNPELEGPYKVDKVVGKGQLEKLINQRHAQGYEVVTILENRSFGSNAGRDVVFKLRD